MAGALVTPTRTSRDIGNEIRKEVTVSLALLSDDTTGLVPSQALVGLDDYTLIEMRPIPDATAPFTAAFEVLIEDANGADLFRSGSVAVDSYAPIGGHNHLGYYPPMDASATFKLVDPADHTSTIDVGNEKEATIVLRFAKK